MRLHVLVLFSALLPSAVSIAQAGFSTQTYPAVLTSASDNTRLLSADFNGDGKPDLVSYGSRYASSTVPGNVFLNNGSGGFLAPTILSGTGTLAAAKIGDMNGDSYPDIVGCTNIGSGSTQAVSISVYLSNGKGTFKALPAVIGNGQCGGLVLGDIYQTGHLDVVTAGHTTGQYGPDGTYYPGATNYIDIFSNDGTGTLTERSTGGGSTDDAATSHNYTNCGVIDVVGGDFLQDGRFDLILTSDCQSGDQNLPGHAGTTFFAVENASPYNYVVYPSYIHVNSSFYDSIQGYPADFSGTGRLDALSVGNQGTSAQLTYLKNNTGGSFTASSLLNALAVYGSGVGDFNGDGRKDIAVAYTQGNPNSPAPQMIQILAGTAGSSFTDSQDFVTGPATALGGDVLVADFNGDGKPDLATLVYDTSTRATSLNIYTNTQGTSSACSAPTTANTNTICAPAKGATLNSPVTVTAASNVAGFTLNRLYLDNQSVYQSAAQSISTPIPASTGSHTLVLVSYNNAGKAFTSTTTFTVGNPSTSGCIPSSAGVTICSPAAGTTDTAPVTFTAGATASSGNITAMRIYIDNNAVYTSTNTAASKSYQFTEPLDVTGGTHSLVIVAYQSTGGSLTKSLTFTTPSGPCLPPSGGTGLKVCSPSGSGTLTSPFSVVAGANTQQGYIAAIRIYLDSNAVALTNNPKASASFTINQSVAASPGTHSLVVVAYPSTGGSLSSQQTITVK